MFTSPKSSKLTSENMIAAVLKVREGGKGGGREGRREGEEEGREGRCIKPSPVQIAWGQYLFRLVRVLD